MTRTDSDIKISKAIQREIDTLRNLVVSKHGLQFAKGKYNNPAIKDMFTDNCNAAINNVNNMIIAIAENISYLQVEHDNEGDSNDT